MSQQPGDPGDAPRYGGPPQDPQASPYGAAPSGQQYGQQPSGGGQYRGEEPAGRSAGRPAAGDDLSPADQRLWSTLTHLAGIFAYVLAPLVAFLVLRDRGLFVQDQTREALNFHITVVVLWAVVGFLSLFGVGLLLVPVLAVAVAVLGVLAAVRANRGERSRYPFTLRLVG